MFDLTEQIELLEQQRRQLELETFNLRKCLVHNEIYRPQTLDFSERGISSTAEQIIENLLKMNCFLEPHNFLPSFFDSIIISLQQESKVFSSSPRSSALSRTLPFLISIFAHVSPTFSPCIFALHFRPAFSPCIFALHFRPAFSPCIFALHFRPAFLHIFHTQKIHIPLFPRAFSHAVLMLVLE
jgi:hypothetical protein